MSSRFKWTDLIVVPVGLMGPLVGSKVYIGTFSIVGKLCGLLDGLKHGGVSASIGLIVSCASSVVLCVGVLLGSVPWYLGPFFAGYAIGRWVTKLPALKWAITILVAFTCHLIWYVDFQPMLACW